MCSTGGVFAWIARPIVVAGLLGALFGGATNVQAEERREGNEADGESVERVARQSVGAGAFLPWTMGARSDAQRALVYGQGGYDGAERGAVYQTVLEAQLYGRFSVRAGGSYLGPSGRFRPEAGLRLDVLRQEQHGVDLAVLGVYEAQGFNTVRAVTARVAVSRAFGDTRLVSNLGYGFGLQDGERYGDFRLAGLHALTRDLQVGLDSRFRIDLERDDDEPIGEPDWELVTGPLATYSIDRFVISATAGLSALKFRLVETTHLGAIGTLGLGAVF
jgi:hypothetical protein